MKKVFALIGMITGAVMILIGILAMSGALGSATSYGGYVPSGYDSGYATFGGDYYTYSVNNSAEAAAGAQGAAENLAHISDFLTTCGGLFLMMFGIMAVCAFGIVYAGCLGRKEEKLPEIVEVLEENVETPEPVSVEIQ